LKLGLPNLVDNPHTWWSSGRAPWCCCDYGSKRSKDKVKGQGHWADKCVGVVCTLWVPIMSSWMTT